MTIHEHDIKIINMLKKFCDGHPFAKIPWPHRPLHAAIARISFLSENDMRVIDGQTSLLKLINEYLAEKEMSDAALCRLAGLSPNTLYNLRKYPKRSINLITAIALTEAMEMKLTLRKDRTDEG